MDVPPAASPAGHAGGLSGRAAAALLGLIVAGALALDGWIIHTYPVIYWYDTYIRLVRHDQIVVLPWLPLLQFVIFGVTRFSGDLTVIRGVMALLAAGALISAYLWASHGFGRATALLAVLLLATNPMFVTLSVVPYTEVLFVGLLMLGLYLYDRQTTPRDRWLAAAVLNLACLTRYEAWALIPLLTFETLAANLRPGGWKAATRRAIGAAALLGTIPALWLASGAVQMYAAEASGTAAAGPQAVLDSAAGFFGLLRQQLGDPLAAAGLIGLALGLVSPRLAAQTRRLAALMILNFPLELLINPRNLRQPFLYVVLLLVFAAWAIERLIHTLVSAIRFHPAHGRAGALLHDTAVLAAAVLIGLSTLPGSLAFVAGAANESELVVCARIGQWLKDHGQAGMHVLIAGAEPADKYAISLYSGIPVEDIQTADATPDLISRLSAQNPELEGHYTYVIVLMLPGADRSPASRKLIAALEDGLITAASYSSGAMQGWVIRTR